MQQTGKSGISTQRSSKAPTTKSTSPVAVGTRSLPESSKASTPISSKAPTERSKSSSTPATSRKSITLTIDGRKMNCVCKISDEREQTNKKLDCECTTTQIGTDQKSAKSVGKNSENGKKYRVE